MPMSMRNPQVLLISCLCLAGAASGCSSIGSRIFANSFPPAIPYYFGGVRTDYETISCPGKSASPIIDSIYSIVDFPFSLVADVLLIPYDVYTDFSCTNG